MIRKSEENHRHIGTFTARGRYDTLMAMGDQIRISVRDLVEFIFREGDIDTRSGGAPEEAMLEGARMHRKIQRQAGADYMAEVPLSILYSTGKVDVLLEGRADGVFLSDPETVRRQAAAASELERFP